MTICRVCDKEIRRLNLENKILIIALILVIGGLSLTPRRCEAEPRLIVIGDSLSSTADSWPSYIEGYNIQKHTQPGRTVRDYQPPRDLRHTGHDDTVVYFLGGNDAGSGFRVKDTRQRMLDHIRPLRRKGFRVIIVPPPKFKLSWIAVSVHRHRVMMLRMKDTCDVTSVWDKADTIDGLHPTASLSYRVANVIQQCLSQPT